MSLVVRLRMRATLKAATCVRAPPKGVGEPAEPPSCQGLGVVILPVNEEFPVSASHQLVLIKSLPFAHTARHYYIPPAIFWDTEPLPQAGGSLTSHRTGPLGPGGLCLAQASVASFQFGVRSFADDPSLSGGILVGSAVPSLHSPKIHPRLWHLPCSGAGPQPGGAHRGGGCWVGAQGRPLPYAGCLPVLMYLVCY